MKFRPGAANRILQAINKEFRDYQLDKDTNTVALLTMGPVVGAIAAWVLHNQGEEALNKALNMIVTTARQKAFEGDSLIRDKKKRVVGDLGGKLTS